LKEEKLSKDFYKRNTLAVAYGLIGKVICRKSGKRLLKGMIVETEAYPGKNDPASHSYIGKTGRNAVMFEDGGTAYVYFTYGNHYCFNVVTGAKGKGSAVLIRGVEPLEEIDIMIKNRGIADIYNLTNGPGKFAQAFKIKREINGKDLTGDEIFITEPQVKKYFKIIKSKRIGITKNADKLYRFCMKDNPFVSGIGRAAIKKIELELMNDKSK
jgi:DNA-3-methyladenine glycosylase